MRATGLGGVKKPEVIVANHTRAALLRAAASASEPGVDEIDFEAALSPNMPIQVRSGSTVSNTVLSSAGHSLLPDLDAKPRAGFVLLLRADFRIAGILRGVARASTIRANSRAPSPPNSLSP